MEQINQHDLIKSDKFMLKLIFIHWFVATFITAHAFNTYLAGFVVGGLITLGVYLSFKFYSQTRFYRITLAIALMSFSALFIQQFYGRIELHFHVFVGLAFLTIYRDRTPIAAGALFIIFHHLIFNYLQQYNISVFDTQIVVFNYGCGLDIVLLHGVFVLAEWFVLDREILSKIEEFRLIKNGQKELSNANQELKKQHEQYQSLMTNSSDGVFIMNMDGKLLDCSEMACKLLGYTKEEILTLHVYDWDINHTKEEALNHIKNTPTIPLTFETKHKRIDGSSYDAEITAVKINIDNQDFVYASVRDISIRKKNEKTIKKQKDKLKSLNDRFELTLEAVNDGIWDWNIKTDEAYLSPRWKSMLGYSEDDITNEGKSFFKLIHDDDKPKVQNAIEAHFKDPVNNPYAIEIRLKAKDGSYKWILARGKAHFNKHGEPVRMVGYHTDITKDKETENQLKHQEKVIAEQSKNAALGDMIGNIAHQWRQPLSVISSGATGMKMQKQFNTLSDEQFERTCDTINENAQYLSKTIDDFRNFIKGDREIVQFNLKETIDRFLNLVQPSFKRNNITLFTKLDESIELHGYPNELIQCFMNIFNNAKDALKNSPYAEKYIFIESIIENDKIIIKFKDNANGIPEDILPRIFEPYFTTKHQSQGTGLGLHMTYNLITTGMKGLIVAQNVNFNHEGEFYNGAEFTITLPLDQSI